MNAPVNPQIKKTVVLVGLMGSGKSTVGRRLANKLGLDFCDSDDEIERAAGCSVADIFELYGEQAFRDVEKKVIERLLSNDPFVLATGGGAYISPDVRQMVTDSAISIWLRADLDVLLERTGRNTNRPLLRNTNPRVILGKLINERHPIYETADIVVDTSEVDLNHTVLKVHRALSDHLLEHGNNTTKHSHG